MLEVCATRRQHEHVLQTDQAPEHLSSQRSAGAQHFAQRVIFVWNYPVHGTLKVTEHGEPHTRPIRVVAHVQRVVVRERVVVEEEARRYVEGNEHVDRVVFMGGQNEEDPKHIEKPRDRVQEVQAPRSVCKEEEI